MQESGAGMHEKERHFFLICTLVPIYVKVPGYALTSAFVELC